ncbi:hypothetical protein [Moraxella catarrhalis]|nr:hypothetical protein [Moraxella catarrhalis]MPX30028.1 hypothetical protein [Moraxella catarrhalis]MPY09069.1 hypothetical protein [Moraxella catarrhalis]RKL85736.1 hypothetical protein D6D65_09020 [Moraxella catarrhalis]RKL86953.1 hypothetical protein D6D77_08940 [Moraxella catarrhalis]RKL96633.1 hypothetical protein D6D74_08825 [Moraxella catarrhalis]
MNKLILSIGMSIFVTGCITKIDQPQPDFWKYFYKHKKHDTSFELIRQDMLACGFTGDSFGTGYIAGDDEHYTKYINARLCMEKKGWINTEGPTCGTPMFKDDPLCKQWQKEHQ